MNMDPAFRGERLVLGPDDFSHPEPYVGAGAPAIRRDGLIAYEAARHRAIADFRAPLCLVLRRPVSAFEVVGEKTPSLTALRIAAILVERVAGAPRPGAAA